MRTEKEITNYLEKHSVSARCALQIGAFLSQNQRCVYNAEPKYSKDKDELTPLNFIRWYHDSLPKFSVGDMVSLTRESHKSICIIEAIIHQDTKPIGCYCDVRNADKGAIQRVNQNKLEEYDK